MFNTKALIFIIVFAAIFQTQSLYYVLRPDQKQKCITEQIPRREKFHIRYNLKDQSPEDKDHVQVVSLNPRNIVFGKPITIENSQEEYQEFQENMDGQYKFCLKPVFTNQRRKSQIRVEFKIQLGEYKDKKTSKSDRKQYKNPMDKEQAKKLYVIGDQTKQISILSNQYVNIQDMNREQEDKLFTENEKIDIRVMYATIFQSLVILGCGVYQIFSLKRFFKQKKLL